jgi:multimeric flavodoxin WrbA
LDADIVIFATPIWWGGQSSFMQRVIERLDEIHDEIMESGKSRLTNKVAGIIVSGDSDGAQHIKKLGKFLYSPWLYFSSVWFIDSALAWTSKEK